MEALTRTGAPDLTDRAIIILDDCETRTRAERFAEMHRRAVARGRGPHRASTR